tara:strand:- start:950 stop:1729 length:780 start_codon:yes stop_codon:yes gene_type:complete
MKKIKLILISLCVGLVTTSAVINILNNKNKIYSKFFASKSVIPDTKKDVKINALYYANDIVNKGGYILFFRHAEREKWIDVLAYDAYELLMPFDEKTSYFKKAVCLSEKGQVQARMMGGFIDFFNIPIQKVISSPSCRAIQTSNMAFGGIDKIENLLLHYGPFNEDMDEFNKSVKKLILKNQPHSSSNIFFSGHNGVIFDSLIDEYSFDTNQDSFDIEKFFHLEEGGFYALKAFDNKLIMVHKFENFQHFLKPLLKRPL